MSIIKSWAGGIALCAVFFGALHLTSVDGASEESRAEAHKTETIRAAKLKDRHERRIAAAKAELARQRMDGLQDDANRMLYPIAQATIDRNK